MGIESEPNPQGQLLPHSSQKKLSNKVTDHRQQSCNRLIMTDEKEDVAAAGSRYDSSGSLFIDSATEASNSSSTTPDLAEDASSSFSTVCSSSSFSFSSTTSHSSNESGPLYELSDLMNQLPIKRGLSKYYDGRSQSFTSLASVKSFEDLARKESPYNKRMKLCRSYGGGLDDGHSHHIFYTPKPTISKRTASASSRTSCLSAMNLGATRTDLFSSCDIRPPVSLQKQN